MIGAQAVITVPVPNDRTAVGLNRILEVGNNAEGVPFQADEAAKKDPDEQQPDDWVLI